jgi:hypothetical protein
MMRKKQRKMYGNKDKENVRGEKRNGQTVA